MKIQTKKREQYFNEVIRLRHEVGYSGYHISRLTSKLFDGVRVDSYLCHCKR
jgi:hypothetical protein